ncbi:MAG: hypothetical protein ACOZQL_32355 [Myxococcota bacterium]
MNLRAPLLLLALAACGRTDLFDEDAGVDAGSARDAGFDAGVHEAPRHVFKGDERCPFGGVESDLRPGVGEELVLVRTKVEIECSGAGGEWLTGQRLDGGRSYAFGGHICYFLPVELQQGGSEWFGLARVIRTTNPVSTPAGWCLTPVTSDYRVRAWGLYPSEAAARTAHTLLSAP